MNGTIPSEMEEAYTVGEVGDHSTELDYDLERAGDVSADAFGSTLGDAGKRDSGYTADARVGDNATGVNEPEALLAACGNVRQDLAREGL
jgi:hypothetical protein